MGVEWKDYIHIDYICTTLQNALSDQCSNHKKSKSIGLFSSPRRSPRHTPGCCMSFPSGGLRPESHNHRSPADTHDGTHNNNEPQSVVTTMTGTDKKCLEIKSRLPPTGGLGPTTRRKRLLHEIDPQLPTGTETSSSSEEVKPNCRRRQVAVETAEAQTGEEEILQALADLGRRLHDLDRR